jgi:ethanolamine utilization microcompartment shell protein EutS
MDFGRSNSSEVAALTATTSENAILAAQAALRTAAVKAVAHG